MDNNYNLLSQINSEADETLAETIWGKPANDIITGINNNSIVPANRSIWELVQNARDVSYEGCKAEIRFIRKDNEFVLLHHFIKKTQKTPLRELEQARLKLNDFLERSNEK